MNSERVSKIIKEIRTKNNLTQKEFADKYNVTYQAVSKWENGKNLPDITLLRDICNDYNIDISDLLLLNKKKNNNKKYFILLGIILLIIISVIIFLIIKNNNKSFEFKTISSSCSDFQVSGSIAYDESKSSIYISNINYCGLEDKNIYQKIECNLYEKNDNISIKISSCPDKNNITLENYLKEISLNINNYQKICSNYTNNSLYLEINAYKDNTNLKTYKIPLSISDNCK